MFKFTKKDKRTNLEREIDEVLVKITRIKSELDNSPSEELDERIKSLMKDMSNVDSGSLDYLNMAKSLEILYKTKASIKSRSEEYSEMVKNHKELCETREKIKERNKEIKKALITGGIQLVGLAIVVKHEDLHVITSKAFSHIPWVRS
jgi:Zn-dependent oligopeptidase